ncbi:MAG: hypothetical protein V4792_10260 [Pseudomonadota bacterium]
MTAHDEPETARQALREACAALDAAEAAGERAALSLALAQVSRCHRRVGALADAVWYAERGLQLARGLSAVDASVDALCELGELALARAATLDDRYESRGGAHRLRDAARDHGFEAAHMVLHSADPQWEITVLLRVSDLFDNLGDHDDAIALQCRAAGLMTRQASNGIDPAPRIRR